MIGSFVVVRIEISYGVSRERTRSHARRPPESARTAPHGTAARRKPVLPRLSKGLPGRSGPAEPKINSPTTISDKPAAPKSP
jgi:hypothetical protein